MLAPTTTQSIDLIPQLHKPFTDPKIRFALYDAPTAADVERSAHVAAAIRGFSTAYDRRPLLADAGAHDIPDLPAPFGGHPRARQRTLPKSLHNIAHPGEASDPPGARPAPPTPPLRRPQVLGLSPRAPPTPYTSWTPPHDAEEPTSYEEDAHKPAPALSTPTSLDDDYHLAQSSATHIQMIRMLCNAHRLFLWLI